MPFLNSFTTSQTLGAPSVINFLDNSTGSDGAITGRRVYMQTASGSFLVETGTSTDYELWSIANISDSFDVLSKDEALRVVVEWVNVSGVALYSATQILGFTLYNETFDYQTTQALSGNPLLINDNRFFVNKSALREYIDSGNQAISFAADIFAAQQCYDRATALRLDSQYSFNINS